MAKKYLDSDGLLYYNQKVNAKLGNKVDKVDGKGLSTNDYTTAEKTKLSGIATGANKTTVENSLTSTSTTNALSANQGKVLDEKIENVMGNVEGFLFEYMGAIQDQIPTDNSQLTNGAGYQTASQVNTAIEAVVGSAPEALDTLKELADSLGNDKNFASTMTTALANKADKSSLSAKQDKLTSGTNIKTINGLSLLGSGNIDTIPTFSTSNWFNNADGIYKHTDSDGSKDIYMVMTNKDGGKEFICFNAVSNSGNANIYYYTQTSSTSELELKSIINFSNLLTTDNIEYTFTKETAIANEWEDMIPTIYAVYKYIEDNVQTITNSEIDTICS